MLYNCQEEDWDLAEYLVYVADRARNAIMSAGRGEEGDSQEADWQISYLDALLARTEAERRAYISGNRLRPSTLCAGARHE